MDGSANDFVELIRKAGISAQSKKRDIIVIDREIVLKDSTSGARIEARPSDEFCISGTIEYSGILGRQSVMLRNMENFVDEIAPARTYGFLSELKALKEADLAKGGNLENAVVFMDNPLNSKLRKELAELFEIDPDEMAGNNGILNQGGLRFPDEPVRHKVLDLIGDLTLLGQPIQGEIIAQKMGHSANVNFVKKLKQEYLQKGVMA
jgi:UDP-3-O-[3-hydroxymyristoyl] N-acetylglucosamine deacetylase/3-hydroxyacyl-[acyl-carrier-protein] dehydratase